MIPIGDKHFPGGIKVDARSEIPVIGTATISGASDLSFQDYCLKATNNIPVPFSEGYWRYDLTVTQLQTKIKWTWITPSGKTMTYTTESPRVDLIDVEKLTAELQSVYEISEEGIPVVSIPFGIRIAKTFYYVYIFGAEIWRSTTLKLCDRNLA